MQNFNVVLLLLRTIIISCCFFSFAACFDGGIHAAGLTCGSYQYPAETGGNNKLMQNLMAAFDAVSFQVKEHGWGAQTLVNSWHPMYALGQCQRDLNPTQCTACFSQARQLLSRCVPKVAGRIYLDGCFLRYDNYSFFGESVDVTRDTSACESTEKWGPVGFFTKRVAAVVLNVSRIAGEKRFAVGGEGGVFALAQCWETVEKLNCQKCLKEAGKKVQGCVPGVEGRSLFTGCFLRYSKRKFYNDVAVTQNQIQAPPQESHELWITVASVLLAIAVVLLIVLAAILSRKRIASHRKRNNDFGASPDFAYIAGFSFRYDVLEKATNYFDPGNKLSHGRDDSVFKGTIPSGATVAVKRLFFNSRQWTDRLFNEVNLISGIQHKNVVKLLGCSIEGPESLLVYEFLPFQSLDQILFDKDTKDVLTWEQRFQIICGIAEGLAYLHEGSGTKIIHRDIKSSNILVDEALNPKIVDFGLTHCVAENKSHLSSAIAGTLGYMAPECLSRGGQLTEKTDVYAFGVMVIEIVCGKKNSVFTQGSSSVLHCVWKNYKANDIKASIDPALSGKFKAEEASNVLQTGLLCTQSNVTLRPSMSEVVQMLTKKDYVIPSPKQQPFVNHTVITLDHRGSNLSIMSNGHASARSSFHSTISSLPQGEDATLLEKDNSFSSTKFISEIPDSNIQVNIVAPQPR